MTAATYRVTAPNREYSGLTGKCQFSNGVYEGPVEDGTLFYFEQQGYAVEEVTDGDLTPVDGMLQTQDPDDLKGKDLDSALKAAGLPTSGKVDDKRARLAEYQESLTVDDDEADDDENGA